MEELNKMIGIAMLPPWLKLQATITVPEGIELDGFNETTFVNEKAELPYVDNSQFLIPRPNKNKIMSCPCCTRTINGSSYKKHLKSNYCEKYFKKQVHFIMKGGCLIDTSLPYGEISDYFRDNNYCTINTLSILNQKYPEDGFYKNNI